MTSTNRVLAAAIALLLVAAGCSNSGAEQEEPPPDVIDEATSADPSPAVEAGGTASDGAVDESDADDLGSDWISELPEECADVEFEDDAVLDGRILGDCVSAAMVLAGSGSHHVRNEELDTIVDFTWDPDFAMYARSDDLGVVVLGDTGWAQLDSEWVEADENDVGPGAMAHTIVTSVRFASHPEVIASVMAESSTWTVIERDRVPDGTAFVDSAWLLVPNEQVELFGVAVTDQEQWITEDFLPAYMTSTGSIMGVSATTTSAFLQWGGPVEIPEPSQG